VRPSSRDRHFWLNSVAAVLLTLGVVAAIVGLHCLVEVRVSGPRNRSARFAPRSQSNRRGSSTPLV